MIRRFYLLRGATLDRVAPNLQDPQRSRSARGAARALHLAVLELPFVRAARMTSAQAPRIASARPGARSPACLTRLITGAVRTRGPRATLEDLPLSPRCPQGNGIM